MEKLSDCQSMKGLTWRGHSCTQAVALTSEQSYKQWGPSVEEQEAVIVETQMMIGADWEKFKVILWERGVF